MPKKTVKRGRGVGDDIMNFLNKLTVNIFKGLAKDKWAEIKRNGKGKKKRGKSKK